MPCNPFWSERLQGELVLRSARPADLPEMLMEMGSLVLEHAMGSPQVFGLLLVDSGKGRGNGLSGGMVFPPSMEQ